MTQWIDDGLGATVGVSVAGVQATDVQATGVQATGVPGVIRELHSLLED